MKITLLRAIKSSKKQPKVPKPSTLLNRDNIARELGLFHISDAAYNFFLKLEQERVDGINISKLTKLKKDMVDKSIQQCANNKVLFNNFENVFDSEAAFNKVKTIFQSSVRSIPFSLSYFIESIDFNFACLNCN